MKQFIFVFFMMPLYSIAQNVGIGTAIPNANALLHVDLGLNINKGLLVTGTYNASATVPDFGAGTRMMFYPGKTAFRAGEVDGTQWDNLNVGFNSIALGYNTTASANYSTALGYNTTAASSYSTAMGSNTFAGGSYSTAMGYFTTTSAYNSTAMGYNTSASGNYSTAMGYFSIASGTASLATGQSTLASGIHSTAIGRNTTASGGYSTAMGYNTTASGVYSTAMGYSTTSSGNFSTAMGNSVSTSNWDGAFIIGDNSTSTVMQSFVANGFRSRFAGGYRLLSNAAATIGVVLLPDQSSWGVISDVRLKENFIPVAGEQILKSIADMPQYTWNYKTQDTKTLRHYGPMAQDFYKAFGRDELGTVGCDTIINQQDFLGVNFIAIQALEKRTAELKQQLDKAMELINVQMKKNDLLADENKKLEILIRKKK